MVCIAGSIGIIGVATVLAISSGMQGYIQSMQNDMLSGNPITISEQTYDLVGAMQSLSTSQQEDLISESTQDGYINVDYFIKRLVAMSDSLNALMLENDISQDYIDYIYSMPKDYYNEIVLDYGLDLSNNLYTDFKFNGQENNNMSLSAAIEIYTAMLKQTDYSDYASYISAFTESFMIAPDSEEFILSQYDIVSSKENSKIAKNVNEIMLVIDENSALTDLLLAQLGYYTQDEFFNIVYKATDDPRYDPSLDKDNFSYDEILGKTFTWYPNDTVFARGTDAINPFTYNAYEGEWSTGIDLTITAILKPKDNVNYGALESGMYYTQALAKEIITQNLGSEIVSYLNTVGEESFNSFAYTGGINYGIIYNYDYEFEGNRYEDNVGFVGSFSSMGGMMGSGSQTTPTYHILTKRNLGGCELPSEISIYPVDFSLKDKITDYLDVWNSDADLTVNGKVVSAQDRPDIQYTDNLALVMSIINTLIDTVTIALVAFSALSLVVSTVMIAIITYVSVMERVKEIGVIRSLGGRKRDVASLFIAETFIIGGVSGVFGIIITYIISLIVNVIVGNLVGIYTIASLPIITALIMILVSIVLTLISGLIPASLAAKKEPVEALRTE